MKVLMLGWEYPPHIAGGLGTACEGLTTALARRNVAIKFVVPHLFGGESANHMQLADSSDRRPLETGVQPRTTVAKVPETIAHYRIPSFLSPYQTPQGFKSSVAKLTRNQKFTVKRPKPGSDPLLKALIDGEVFGVDVNSLLYEEVDLVVPDAIRHGGDIFDEVEQFTARVIERMSGEDFDLIHAHDWMTFPAGVALSQLAQKPLVVHVHSLEYDRSGIFVNEQINQIERFGLERADHIIAVSHYTQRQIQKYHGIRPEKVTVVHNGVYPKDLVSNYKLSTTWPRHVVLFLGRVTYQKGPDYFVEVASRVASHVPDVLFVLAGTGDMLDRLKARVHELGLSNNFLFPGFLRGEEVEEMYSAADLYVMPSVSEPFGISALEAINFETPVIISKQSGVAEVLGHALKTDFWDLDRMADLIINGLLHEELREDMITMAKEELKRLHWDASAAKTEELYVQLVA